MEKVTGAKKKEILAVIFGSVEEAEHRLGMVKEVFDKIDHWVESSFFASLIEQTEGGKITTEFDLRKGTVDFLIGGDAPSKPKDLTEAKETLSPNVVTPKQPQQKARRVFKESDVRKISLDDLREEAERLGIDVSHLGRKKTKIIELLNNTSSQETTQEAEEPKSKPKPKPKPKSKPKPQPTPVEPTPVEPTPEQESSGDDLNFLDDFDNNPVDGETLSEGFEVVVEEVYIPKSTKFSSTLSNTYASKTNKGKLDLRSIRSSADEIDVDALNEPEA